jgi:hypothetical protein
VPNGIISQPLFDNSLLVLAEFQKIAQEKWNEGPIKCQRLKKAIGPSNLDYYFTLDLGFTI